MSGPGTMTPQVDRRPTAHGGGALLTSVADPHGAPPPARTGLARRVMKERAAYLFVLPGLLYFVIFHYVPLAGLVIAFQHYSPFRGFAGSEWVGLENFLNFAGDVEFTSTIANTLIISGLQLIFAFPAPILLALLLNSLLSERIKRLVQTVVYLPHFLSWVIVVSIWQQILGGAGTISQLLSQLGLSPLDLMSDPDTFKILLTSQVVWKETGWGTIIFFAAISSISADLYESAACDGAGGWRRMWHVTLPGLVPVIVLLLILRLGDVLSVGFEQILLQQPSVGADAAQVLDTFIYFRGVRGGDWGIGAAAGLIKGVVGTLLIVVANRLAKRAGTEGII